MKKNKAKNKIKSKYNNRVLFENNNHKSKENKNWLLVIKIIGNFLVGFATIASSVAICITLLEMRSERNQSYKPYLIIETQNYNEEFEESPYLLSDTNNLWEVLRMDEEDIIPMSITIDNIGSGTATDIVVTFSEQQCKSCWEKVCSYYNEPNVKVTDDKIYIKSYLEYFDEIIEYEYNMDNNLTIDRSYVLSEDGIQIPIPEEYRRLIHGLAYCTKGDYESPFIIELEIEYSDLQGIKYHKKYQLSIEMFMERNLDSDTYYVEYMIYAL